MSNRLPQATARQLPEDNQFRTGVVSSVSGRTVKVVLGQVVQGPFAMLASYASPAAGDKVVLLRVGSSWLVLGEIG